MDTYRRSGIVTGILFIAATAAGILAIVRATGSQRPGLPVEDLRE